jgi:hypothetical protein
MNNWITAFFLNLQASFNPRCSLEWGLIENSNKFASMKKNRNRLMLKL